MDCSLPGSSVLGILQARILEWVVIPFSRGSSCPRDRIQVFHMVGRHFTIRATNKDIIKHLKYVTTDFSSIQFSCSVMSDSLQPHGLQRARLPCPSPTPGACSNSCPSSLWCDPTISFSIVPFSSHLQSFPASRSFPRSQFFASNGPRTGPSASASVLLMNIQDWFPLGFTDLISLQSQGLSRVFTNTTVQKHQFFSP